jgi:hypothetical protein
MTTVHDIFLRAYSVEADQKEKRKPSGHSANSPKWPEHALVFDTESRISADQSLTFGVYQRCQLVEGRYTVTEEGVFYADDLSKKEIGVLQEHINGSVSDIRSFPPRFPMYSRADFMRRVFWPDLKFKCALVVGFNLPFDLTRIALDWSRGSHDEWSLTMSKFANGRENRNRPRLTIQPIDSKKAFIRLTKPWRPEEWKDEGSVRFLDLRTLAWALFNRPFSLKSLCAELKTNNHKQDHEPTGKVSPKEIEYARQDVRCTVDCLNALKISFDRHPIGLKPHNAYSPASVAKSYLDQMGIVRPSEKFVVSNEILGIAMQSYYGGRSETRIRRAEVPVVPVDFTSEYPSCCALLDLFDILTAENVTFGDDTDRICRFLKGIALQSCFNPATWSQSRFFALVQPDNDILPVRAFYNDITQNIGNNHLVSSEPLWFAGPDLIASMIRTGRVPRIIRAIRMVPHGKQPGMQSVNLRGMVEIDPYNHDLFRKVIEQRRLHKSDPALYYWLKIFANSIYGFFVELNPETKSHYLPVHVFSGSKNFHDDSDVLEKPGAWFFPPLASLITSAGRLLLAMTEACVEQRRGTYLFCDTDSLAIVSSKRGGTLRIPGSDGVRILSWAEVKQIVDRFAALNPYDREIVKGSILNLVDANFAGSDPKKPQRQLHGYSIAAKRYALYERIGTSDIKIVDPKAHGIGFLYPPKNSPKDWEESVPQWIYEMWDYIVRGALELARTPPAWLDIPQMMRLTITTCKVLKMLGDWKVARPYNFLLIPMVDPTFGHSFYKRAHEKVLLVSEFTSHQDRWLENGCVNVHSGKQYKMVDCTRDTNPPHNVVFPSQFARLLIEYQLHPEAKSLAPDGTPCVADTNGLLRRADITAGEFRYIGKETDRKWEEGDDGSLLEFKTPEFGRATMVIATEEVKAQISEIGINKCARESGFDRKNFVRKLVRDIPVKRNSYNEFIRWLDRERLRVTSLPITEVGMTNNSLRAEGKSMEPSQICVALRQDA